MANPTLTAEHFADNLNVTAGEHTYGTPTVKGRGQVIIGRYCSIAGGVTILAFGDHHLEWVTTYPLHGIDGWEVTGRYPRSTNRSKDIVIGNDVWIGQFASILHGTVIGDGAVVGANAVVCGEVRPYAIVVGNPAKETRRRFDDDTIDSLLRIKWWEWSDDKVKKNIKLLLADPRELCKEH